MHVTNCLYHLLNGADFFNHETIRQRSLIDQLHHAVILRLKPDCSEMSAAYLHTLWMISNDLWPSKLLSFVLKINSHQDSTRNFFPANTFPEFRAALVVVSHHNYDPFHPSLAEAIEAFVQ